MNKPENQALVLEQMSDIFVALPVDNHISPEMLSTMIVVIFLLFIGLFYVASKNWRNPLKRLNYQLKHKTISPREAAHQLAFYLSNLSSTRKESLQLKPFDKEINHLKQLRFQREEPSHESIMILITEIKNS